MKLIIEKQVAVITPTIGKPELEEAMISVQKQTYGNIQHVIVVDGEKFMTSVIGSCHYAPNTQVVHTPTQTGLGGYYGHRIYAAYSHLVNADYIFFLDEDNWWDENHVESLVNLLEEKNLDFAHSLRKVYINREYLADDCCEAIGRWPIAWSRGENPEHLVDTSSYAFRKTWLTNFCQLWHHGWGGDRRFFMLTKDQAKYDTTGLHTLNYELPNMDKAYGGEKDIFEKYNQIMLEKYSGKYPWK